MYNSKIFNPRLAKTMRNRNDSPTPNSNPSSFTPKEEKNVTSVFRKWKKWGDFNSIKPPIYDSFFDNHSCHTYVKTLKYLNMNKSETVRIPEIQIYGMSNGSTVLRIQERRYAPNKIATTQKILSKMEDVASIQSKTDDYLWIIENHHQLETLLQQACKAEASIKELIGDVLSHYHHNNACKTSAMDTTTSATPDALLNQLSMGLRNEENALLLRKKAHAALPLASGFNKLYHYKQEFYATYRQLLFKHADYADKLADAIHILDTAAPASLLNAESLQRLTEDPSNAVTIAALYLKSSIRFILINKEFLKSVNNTPCEHNIYLTIHTVHLSETSTVKIGNALINKCIAALFSGISSLSDTHINPAVSFRIGKLFLNNLNDVPDRLEDGVISVLQNIIILERDKYWEEIQHKTKTRWTKNLVFAKGRNNFIKKHYGRDFFEDLFDTMFNPKNILTKYHQCFNFIATFIGKDILSLESDKFISIHTLQQFIDSVHFHLGQFEKAKPAPTKQPIVARIPALEAFITIADCNSHAVNEHHAFLTMVKAKSFDTISLPELWALKQIIEKIHPLQFKTSKKSCQRAIQLQITHNDPEALFSPTAAMERYTLWENSPLHHQGKPPEDASAVDSTNPTTFDLPRKRKWESDTTTTDSHSQPSNQKVNKYTKNR